MTIVTQDRGLINYDYIRSIEYLLVKDFFEVFAQFVASEGCMVLGQYKNLGAVQTALDDLADAIENGAALFRMPMC